MKYNFSKLIESKESSNFHTKEEIDFIINSYILDEADDDSMYKWIKAVYDNGMSDKEVFSYTDAIINSGKTVKFNNPKGYIIDKHSTGGIGDKVSLILGPILAACGCYVPMIVGRSLGHTGGTLDKLESIPGYNGFLKIADFRRTVENVGISIIGQTDEICPADKKIYALRDKTNLIASFPLICGSIMGKKIAEGIQGLVLDIKSGNGAFMEKKSNAIKLGNYLSQIGEKFNVSVKYTVTDMNQPLGKYAGLTCEISESIDSLKGNGPKDLMDIVFKLGELALNMADCSNPKKLMRGVIDDGSAYDTFLKMVFEHNGRIEEMNITPKYYKTIKTEKSGYLNYINTKNIGYLVNELNFQSGPSSGVKSYFNNNDYINNGDTIFKIFSDKESMLDKSAALLRKSFLISDLVN